MSRPPDRSSGRPRRTFRERQHDRGDRETQHAEGRRAGNDRPRRPWREKRPDDQREAGPEERNHRRPPRPRHDEGRAKPGPWRKERPEDRGQGRAQDERHERDRPGIRPERQSDRPRPERRPHWQRRPDDEKEDRVLIWGIHAVDAALRNPKREIKRLLLTDNAAHRLADALRAHPLTPQSVAPRDLDRELGSDTVHQGALLETASLPEPSLDEVLASGPHPLLVVLDQVTDPHNAGAILRSAAAFGVAAVIMTRRHSPPSSGALAKSASGALELVPVLHVANLARSLTELGEKGVLRVGLEGEAEVALEEEISAVKPPRGPIALVLGAEESGLRRLSKDNCDRLVRLSTPGSLRSLNVSNAAAIAMHHIAMARKGL